MGRDEPDLNDDAEAVVAGAPATDGRTRELCEAESGRRLMSGSEALEESKSCWTWIAVVMHVCVRYTTITNSCEDDLAVKLQDLLMMDIPWGLSYQPEVQRRPFSEGAWGCLENGSIAVCPDVGGPGLRP